MQTFSLCFVIVLALAAVAAAHSATPAAHVAVTREKLHDDRMQGMLKFVDDMMHSSFRIRHDPSVEESATFECAMCVVALNEVSGLLAENRTETEIMDFVDKDICSHLGGDVGKACEALVADLPEVIGNIDGYFEPNVACSKDLHMCAAAPFEHEHSVVFDIPTYVVDLDLPANQRWSQLCSNETFKAEWQQMTTWIKAGLSDGGKYIEEFGQLINHMIGGDYGEEIQGCATELGVGYGWVTFVNIGFEASAFCTSIVAETEDGTILHARNLDFPAGSGFTNTLRNISVIADFQTGGKTVYKTTTFAGFVGALSGQVPGGWSITINTRWNPNGLTGYFDMIVDGLEHKNFSMVTILARETLATIPDWTGAVKHLSDYPILAPVYYTVAGVGSGEGAIITRNMTEAVNVWTLDAAAGRWFELETNYDHWKPAPWFDDRRDPGNAHMKEIGQAGLTLDKMFTDVLSVKPTLNLETTYSFLSIPANGTYKSYGHICGEEDGCVQ